VVGESENSTFHVGFLEGCYIQDCETRNVSFVPEVEQMFWADVLTQCELLRCQPWFLYKHSEGYKTVMGKKG